MEFKFNINNILGDEVSKVDNSLTPFRNNHASSTYKSQLCTIIDEMGVASAKAQGLPGAITGASRLAHSDHHVYIMKDGNAQNGEGTVVGILKVGRKKLFTYDHHGRQHEMEPVCVLDFYVHESKQRTGCGKKLFEFMLKEEQVRPVHLAIDRPSGKFINFLARHYNLKATINQVNNFVIFEGFFRDRPAEPVSAGRRCKPPVHPYRQNSTERWQHSSGRHDSASQMQREAAGTSREDPVWERRHGSPSLLAWTDSGQTDTAHTAGVEALKNIKPRDPGSAIGERVGSGKNTSLGGVQSPSHRALGAQSSMYSRHQEAAAGPPGASEGSTRRGFKGYGTTPPMLRRDGPSNDYLALRNNISPPSGYQDRRGHLLVSEQTSPVREVKAVGRQHAGSESSRSATSVKSDSSWNVFGVPSASKTSQRHHQTQLW